MTERDTQEPDVALVEGATVFCACGWWGWVHPDTHASQQKIERECPDCRRLITVEATVKARYVDTDNQQKASK